MKPDFLDLRLYIFGLICTLFGSIIIIADAIINQYSAYYLFINMVNMLAIPAFVFCILFLRHNIFNRK